MSTIRDPAYITNAGRTMMTAGGEVTYTKAVLYGQDISGLSDSQIKALTSLGNPLREVKIGVSDKQSSDSGSTVILEAVFQNSDLKADLQYKAVGFFARKNDMEQLVIVAVANQGAYLAATNPDGVATDALDLKIAVKIGDATSVTAVIDPAGSVTPASLNSAIKQATQELTAKIDTKSNSQDVQNALNQKADKSTVEDSLATKANVTDLNQLSSELAKKAESSDLANLVTEVNKKANSDDVTAQISDVNKSINAVSDTVTKNKDAIDKQIASLTTTVNAKVDASYSYSREELDKKFLALSVSADGKMSAEQVTNMIATKADKSYVDEKLDEKADKSSVDAKINAIDFSKIKFRKQYVNSDGQTADKTWSATKNKDGTYTIDLWQDDWTASKLTGVLVQLPNKADTSTVNAQIADAKNTAQSNLDKVKSDLNGAINTKANSSDLTALDKKAVKSVGIYPNNLHFESGSFNYWSSEVKASPDANGYALIDLTDDIPVRAAADQLNVMLTGLNHLQGKQTKDSADANALSETGVYYCSSPAKNFPVSRWGTLVTSNGNGARASQLYFPDDNSAVWFRTLNGDWQGWVRLANIDDVNNAESSLTSSINAVNNKVNVTVPLFRRITAGNTWNDILGASNGDTPVLVSIRDEGGANTLGNYSAAVAFGGGDTKGVLNVAYSDHTARIIGGNGNAPVWHEDIAWKSDISNLQNIINQQNQTIQSLTTRLTNAENEINYIKANYVEGRTFPASQEAQANSWENENPQRIAFIER